MSWGQICRLTLLKEIDSKEAQEKLWTNYLVSMAASPHCNLWT